MKEKSVWEYNDLRMFMESLKHPEWVKKRVNVGLSYPMFSAALQDIEEFQQSQFKLGVQLETLTGSINPLIFGNELMESYLIVLASIFNDKKGLIEDFVYGEDFGRTSNKTIQSLYNELINS